MPDIALIQAQVVLPRHGKMLFSGHEMTLRKGVLPWTKTHRMEGTDDLWWDVSLRFDEYTMPDGSTSSGFLRFHNWYGELYIYFDGGSYACFTEDPGLYDAVFALIGAGE